MNEIIDRHYKTIGYATGCCFAEIFAAPIYAIKTNYQTSNDNSAINVVKTMYKNHGIFGFYNSIVSSMLAKIMSSFIKYAIYAELKHYTNAGDENILNNIFIGCITGILCSFFVHPMDVLTNNLQRFKKMDKSIFQFNILYAGFTQTLIRNFILYSFLFPVFDYAKHLTNNNILLSCMMTTTISTTVLQPIDYLRTKIMAQQKVNIASLKFFKSCWKGYHINYIANTTHFFISMSITQLFTNHKN